jgi:hypothetical protein
MRPETKELHFAILRMCKGILSAWERWLKVYNAPPINGVDETFKAMGADKK